MTSFQRRHDGVSTLKRRCVSIGFHQIIHCVFERIYVFESVQRVIMMIDDKIWDGKLQCDFNTTTAMISVLFSGKIKKEETLSPQQQRIRIIQDTKFIDSSLERHLKTKKNHWKAIATSSTKKIDWRLIPKRSIKSRSYKWIKKASRNHEKY